MPDTPNILILMPDQWRADCLSCAGHPIVRTPNVDRLAAEGTRFARAYTTCPICVPARGSFLTGLFPHNLGQLGNYGVLPPGIDTYLHHVRAQGYRTCHIGKSHLHPHVAGKHLRDGADWMHDIGFDDVFETTGPHATRTTDSILTDRWRACGCLDTFRDDYTRREDSKEIATWPSPMPPGEHMDDVVGQTAEDYLSNYDRSEPWLTFVGFGGPHEPWDPPVEWAERYDWQAMDAPLPATEPGPWVPPAAAAHQRHVQRFDPRLHPEAIARIRALYYAKISHVDHCIGRVLDVVRQRGWDANTAVLFWSDHGEMLGDKRRVHKMLFYEPSVHVPLILRTPDRAGAGAVRSQIVSLVDAFPTLLDLAGAPPRPVSFRRSLLPLAHDAAAAHHDAVFSEIDDRTMVFDGRFKLVVCASGETLKLYDLANDPTEAENLVGKPGAEAVTTRLRERLLLWFLSTKLGQRDLRRPSNPGRP